MRTVRIGCGAGYSGDRIEPAVELAREGNLQYLVFECLAERTIALAQQARRLDPSKGYDPMLAERMEAVLPDALARGIKIITNMGAANPVSSAACVERIVRELPGPRLRPIRIAVVTGDDVLEQMRIQDQRLCESGRSVAELGDRLVSANAYIGAWPIALALSQGADIVIAGRVADSALFLAPLVHEFDWPDTDWIRLGRGTIVGHLLECAGQITGGYFDCKGIQEANAMARLGFPLAEVGEDGHCLITKVEGSGGEVSVATCTEQLLYEIHDPQRYLAPDVTADLSDVQLMHAGHDKVSVRGGSGRAAPERLKVSVGILDGFLAEAEISYAGGYAKERGRLACQIVAERLRMTGVNCDDARFDLIGLDSLHGPKLSCHESTPYEVRVRVAARTRRLIDAERVAREVEALYTNGPAGGGGVRRHVTQVISMESCLVSRDLVRPTVHMLEVAP